MMSNELTLLQGRASACLCTMLQGMKCNSNLFLNSMCHDELQPLDVKKGQQARPAAE